VTTPDEIAAIQLERAAYLTAFYDLTKDTELRWSTHEAIATEAGIPQERIMAVSRHLADGGLVKLRTMGGIHGSVELTNRGVYEAERLMQSGEAQKARHAADYGSQSDRDWADAFMPIVAFAYATFVATEKWPNVDVVQRVIDRQELDIDVREALKTLPRRPGEVRWATPSEVIIPLRVIRFVPDSAAVMAACLLLVQRGVELYLAEADELRLTSDDPAIASFGDPQSARTAALLLLSDFPNPFAGGGYSPEGSWNLGINGATARRFRDVDTLDEYFERQWSLLEESQKEFAAFTEVDVAGRPVFGISAPSDEGTTESHPTDAPTVFVVMPFTEGWSTGVYDFIKRAVRSLGYRDDHVIRADTITKPGRIDPQIIEAITGAEVVVGDITRANPNVMWELGYAEAAEVPCVLLNQAVEESPFDLSHIRQVPYRLAPTDEDEANLAAHIQSALEERRRRE
jgi:hypothetical protein